MITFNFRGKNLLGRIEFMDPWPDLILKFQQESASAVIPVSLQIDSTTQLDDDNLTIDSYDRTDFDSLFGR